MSLFCRVFFTHVASENKLPGLSISGALGANGLKKLFQQTPFLKICDYSIKISLLQAILSVIFVVSYIWIKCSG